MAEHDDCAERGKGDEEEAEGGVDDAEEGGTDSLGHDAKDEDQNGEPSHQARGGH